MKALYSRITQYVVTARCEHPLHIGSADGEKGEILIHPNEGKPFVQASGIAGALAEYIEINYGTKRRKELFGNADAANGNEGKSKVVVTDGQFKKETIKIEMRTRCSLNKETGSVNKKKVKGSDRTSGQLLDTEYIGKGAEFIFALLLYGNAEKEMEESFAAMDAGKVRLGGQNTLGCGRISLQKVQVKEYDLTKEEDRKEWAEVVSFCEIKEEIDETDKKDRTKEIKEKTSSLKNSDYQISFHANLDTAVLIKANMIEEDKVIKEVGRIDRMPNAMNIINAQKEYIIPGSSLKGVFRSRMESIGQYLGIQKEKIDGIFENRSKILFEDSIINHQTGKEVNAVTRIHINKITGSVKYKELFSELVAGGDATITIYVDKGRIEKSDAELIGAKACVGIILYVIRDLAVGAVNIGSGAAVGRGFLNIDKVCIKEGSQKKAEFSMQSDVEDTFVKECLKAVANASKVATDA